MPLAGPSGTLVWTEVITDDRIGVWGGESEAAPNGKFSLPRRGVESVPEKFVPLPLPVRVLAYLCIDAFFLACQR